MNRRGKILSVLIRVLEHGEYLKEALDEEIMTAGESSRDSALIRRQVRGTVERMMELDSIIDSISSMKLRRMHPVVRNILRMGTYEIRYMDSIPASAAVNECVRLAKKRRQARAAGMINALLRKISEGNYNLSDDISTRYSMPEWIVDMLEDSYGENVTGRILNSFFEETPVTVRVNRSKISLDELVDRLREEGVDALRIEGWDMALEIKTPILLNDLNSFKEGFFYVQSIGSMAVCSLAEIKEKERVIDVCASPGGKSVHAADLTGKEGYVRAQDISERKLYRIHQNAKRLGFSNIETRVWDAAVIDKNDIESFDVCLADVPCSGLGVLGRKPEIKYRLTREAVDELAEIQANILNCTCRYVRPGGRLVYSTCTITPMENELQIKKFLQGHFDFEIIEERRFLPGDDSGSSDGFYICVMKKR